MIFHLYRSVRNSFGGFLEKTAAFEMYYYSRDLCVKSSFGYVAVFHCDTSTMMIGNDSLGSIDIFCEVP